MVGLEGGRVGRGTLEAMLDAAGFRGPDGRGRWRGGADGTEAGNDGGDASVAFGYLALHTTPESVHERQPLADAEAGLVLVADARLDNRDELLRELTPRRVGGIVTDAELILAAYRAWGEGCAERLLGDFAVAVWDGRKRSLFLARDVMGMRGLYYRIERGRVLFATEVKQILAAPGVDREIFEPAVGAHLVGAYGPAEWTFWEGTRQVPPGHAVVVEEGRVRSRRYWEVDPERRIRYGSDEEYAEHFRSLFADAVRARLRSVAPVGVLLSGGTDSGSVAAMAGWLLAREPGVSVPEFRAYSFAFDELTECDERHISGPLAEHFGIPVTDVPADDAWPLRNFPERGPDLDSPYTVVYQLLRERACEAAKRDGVATLMTGDRGDEVVGDWVYDLPGLVAAGRWREALEERRAHRGMTGGSVISFLRSQLVGPAVRAVRGRDRSWLGIPPWIPTAFSERIDLPSIIADGVVRSGIRHPAGAARHGRIFRAGGDRAAVWQERSNARAGLGWADPWSDRRLTEFVLAVPQHLVNRIAEPKRLAHHALRPLMPPSVRGQSRKIIPALLFERGFKERGADTVRELFADSIGQRLGFVDAGAFLSDYERFRADERIATDPWWTITLEGWLRVVGAAQGDAGDAP